MQPGAAGERERSPNERERSPTALIETLGVYRPRTDHAAGPASYVIDFIESTRQDGAGAEIASLAGAPLADAIGSEPASRIEAHFTQALEARKVERFDIVIDRRTVEITAVPRDHAEIIATFADVTEMRLTRERLAREEIRFRRIVDAVQDYAIYMLDPEGRISSWNSGAARIKGYRADEILGRHFSRFYTPEDIAAHLPERELEVAQRAGRFEGEGWRIRKDGTRFWANVIISPIRDADGTLLGFTKVTRDLTERMKAEEIARKLAAEAAATRRIEAVQRVIGASVAHLNVDELLRVLCEGTRDLMHTDTCTVMLRDDGSLVPVASRGLEDEVASGVHIPIGFGIAGRVAGSGKAIAVADIATVEVASGVLRAQLKSIAAAPLVADGRAIGVIRVGTRERRDFGPDDLSLLQMIADRAAISVDRAHAYAVLADSEARFRSTFEHAAVGIAHFSLDGKLLRANDSLQKMLGYDEAWLRDHFAELSHPENPGTPENAQMVFRGELPNATFEKRYVRKDGSTLWGRVNVSRVADAPGQPPYLIALLEDITERREHEERMRKLLAREQAAVAEQVRARQQMEEALRGRDVFLAVAAHELRTPLTPMRLQVDAMLRDLDSPQPEVLKTERFAKKFRVIERQTRRLEALVSNLLDTSRIASGQLELHPEEVAIDELVRRVVRYYEPDAQAAKCSLELTVTPGVYAFTDRARIEQIVANLVSNAIRYGSNKPVRVAVGVEGSDVRIAVRDEGIGIAADDLRRIFDRFERAASERHYGGLGLGLWITRQLVDALGGRIRVESELGKGSTFVVTLPLHKRDDDTGG